MSIPTVIHKWKEVALLDHPVRSAYAMGLDWVMSRVIYEAW